MWTIVGAFASRQTTRAILESLVFLNTKVLADAAVAVVGTGRTKALFTNAALIVGGGIAACQIRTGVALDAVCVRFADDRGLTEITFAHRLLAIGAVLVFAALDLSALLIAASLTRRAIAVGKTSHALRGVCIAFGFCGFFAVVIGLASCDTTALFSADRTCRTIRVALTRKRAQVTLKSRPVRDTLAPHTAVRILLAIFSAVGVGPATSAVADLVGLAIFAIHTKACATRTGVALGFFHAGGIALVLSGLTTNLLIHAVCVCCASGGTTRTARGHQQNKKNNTIQKDTHLLLRHRCEIGRAHV